MPGSESQGLKDDSQGSTAGPESLCDAPDAATATNNATVNIADAGVAAALQVDRSSKNEQFLDCNPVMQAIRSSLPRIAQSDAPVLICGESGVGKEVIAREIHVLSPRAGRPFLNLNCTAIPSDLLESELFGYERGAFTGAYKTKPGLFELAAGGTVLLDEMGDMDVRLQSKLLHVLQNGEIHPLGARETLRVDVRVIAATNCDLEQAVQERRFRGDLYYRLNVIQIRIPPLRERKNEISGLVQHFLRKYEIVGAERPVVPPQLMQLFLDYDWPGNIRELENAIHRLSVLQDPNALMRDFGTSSRCSNHHSGGSEAIDSPARAVQHGDPGYYSVLQQAERAKQAQEEQAIREALHAALWNRKRAARLLMVGYKSLLYRMKKLGIFEPPEQ